MSKQHEAGERTQNERLADLNPKNSYTVDRIERIQKKKKKGQPNTGGSEIAERFSHLRQPTPSTIDEILSESPTGENDGVDGRSTFFNRGGKRDWSRWNPNNGADDID